MLNTTGEKSIGLCAKSLFRTHTTVWLPLMRSTWNGGTRETHYAELVLIRQAYIDSANVRNCSGEEKKNMRALRNRRRDPIIKCLPCADDITSVNDHCNDSSRCTQLIYSAPTARHHCDKHCSKNTAERRKKKKKIKNPQFGTDWEKISCG